MTDIGHLDFETYCELDIRKVGGHRYARHPSCEVLIAAYLLPGMEEPEVWLPRQEAPPARLVAWVRSGGKLGAHNAAFERVVWRHALRRMHPSVPEVKDSQWVCTAAKAAASGLPRSLDKALTALGLPVSKDMEGSKLIKVFCSPKKPSKKDPRTRILPEQDARFQRFIEYCQQDVRGEVALDEALPGLIPRERRMFILDMVMNDRGLPIDLPLVEKALTVVQALERDIAAKVATLTGGLKATQVQKMLDFFSERGIDLENMRAETVRQALKNEDLSEDAKTLLELRVEAGKASTKKLISMKACADPDDWVVQGGFLYHGAHTGRYAGRLVQPHNFIRGLLKDHHRDLVFALLEYADPELFMLLLDGAPFVDKKGNPLTSGPVDAISQCMRGFIKAPDGYELAVVDYTAIEARVLAWICDEEHMLEAYRQGVDVYKLMAVKLYKLKSLDDVTDEQRRIAKNLVLGCGYQLGGVKFVDYAANAGVIITEEFAKTAVKAYRDGHPNIVKSWGMVERLVAGAIRNPGEVYTGLKCKFYMREHWLCIQLPSGREIRYPYARAIPVERWGKPAFKISFRTEIKGQFVREKTYGGKLIENIVQAIARDVMMEGMLAAETGGYPVLGTVHDELLTLRKLGTSNIKELEELVCVRHIKWTAGMPLASKGFTCIRYKKD
ncbi:DNA polymerase [Bacteriophage sp.]|nr:DNA polymerase [Caudoviricetes sp.]UOF79979.1 DNA polymerase [Bacteriophage sp.]